MFLTPSPDINYNFVAGVYLFATVLCAALYLGQKLGPENDNPVEGFWIIFCPFVPGLLWATVMRARWLAQQAPAAKEKKEL
jgi:hypothetical protein